MNTAVRVPSVPGKHKLTVEDFLVLDRNGAFDGYSKTELIDGEIYIVNAQHNRHARFKSMLMVELNIALRALGSSLEAWNEGSTRLSDHSLPEPDIVLTSQGSNDQSDVVQSHTIALLVEVSETTLRTDLGRKLRAYARAGIPEYWVADLKRMIVHQFTGPIDDKYAVERTTAIGERINAATIPGLSVTTDLLR